LAQPPISVPGARPGLHPDPGERPGVSWLVEPPDGSPAVPLAHNARQVRSSSDTPRWSQLTPSGDPGFSSQWKIIFDCICWLLDVSAGRRCNARLTLPSTGCTVSIECRPRPLLPRSSSVPVLMPSFYSKVRVTQPNKKAPPPALWRGRGCEALFTAKTTCDSRRQNNPFLRQQRLNRLPEPQGQRSFRPNFSSSSLSPCTTCSPRFTCVSDGKPRRHLLIVSKAVLIAE
jgi:hypothetical protein